MPDSIDTTTIAADYALRPSELAETLRLMIEAKEPCMVWGPPGTAKSDIAGQVAAGAGRDYRDVRALLLDPIDLRGIPWIDENKRTRWASPDFLPPETDTGLSLINLEELPSAVPMVQAALYQLVLDRKIGEYTLPDGASVIACGNRVNDRGLSHRMLAPLASRFIHIDIRVDPADWHAWAIQNGIAPEVAFFIQWRPELLHKFPPQHNENAFACPRTWHKVSNVVNQRADLSPSVERAIFRGAVGQGPATEFAAFLKTWRELPHPQDIIDDPENARVPYNISTLMVLCGSLYQLANPGNFDAIVAYALRLPREIGEFLVWACRTNDPSLERTPGYIRWAAARTN